VLDHRYTKCSVRVVAVLDALRTSLEERLTALRGDGELPPALLDVMVRRYGDIYLVVPCDWEQLRHEEGGAGRGVPYWARPWPAGLALASVVSVEPGARVLELGCGLAAPSIAAARGGASVLATDGSSDAVAFAAHCMALNEADGEVAVADWANDGDVLVERGPWDVVLAADVFYTQENVKTALRLFPRLVADGGRVLVADPGRAGARDFLAAARASFRVTSETVGEVTVYTLTRGSSAASRRARAARA
jgi:predicted nicotinamide N-methyase